MSSDPTEFLDDLVETGFVTVAVNTPSEQPIVSVSEQPIVSEPPSASASEPPAIRELTHEEVQAAKALVGPPDITTVALAQFARELAQDIGLLPAILLKYKLTQAQYEFLEKHNKFFRSTLRQEIKNWQSVTSTEARLRLQAQAALEQQMPIIANRMGNAAEKLGDAVEAFKVVAKIAGVDTPPAGPVAAGERYQIVIDLGAGSDLVIAAKGRAQTGAASAEGSDIRQITKGKGETV